MSNVARWVYGDTVPVIMPVGSTTVIEIGDIIVLDSNEAKPASALTGGASLAAAQQAVHDVFVGVAEQQSRNGDTEAIRVGTAGIWRFPTPSANFNMGDLIGVNDDGSNNPVDQNLIAAAAVTDAIGYCVSYGTGLTEIRVKIISTIFAGGVQSIIT